MLLSPQGQGFVTVEQVRRRLSWASGRVIDALETLLEVCIFSNMVNTMQPTNEPVWVLKLCNFTINLFTGGPCNDRQWH